MRVSWNWLKVLVEVDVEPRAAARRLTFAGLEVEAIEELGGGFEGVVVAEVLSSRPHPKSAKLTLVTVTDQGAAAEVVCGAPNVPAPGERVLWARPGARLPGGREIAVKEVAGVASPGMLCSELELGIGTSGEGIIILEAGTPGQTAQDALELRDVVLDVNVPANRGDCLGHLGIAREIAGLCRGRLVLPGASLEAFTGDGELGAEAAIEDPEGCPRYTLRVIDDLVIAPSPRWMQRRLEAVGVRSISNLVDVTNFVMLELGHPLHAFDLANVRGPKIIVRRARAGEKLTTLDGQERILVPGDLLICDAERPVALAGVMGGAGSEVEPTTTSVLLEAATFDPRSVRRTSKRLGLRSEASYRFERGVDAEGVPFASARAARLLAELGRGRVRRGLGDVYPRPVTKRTLSLRPARTQALLGLDLSKDTIADHLRALSLEVTDAGETLTVVCPTFRQDLEREVDLIEEVARMHGFEDIPGTLPPLVQAPGVSARPRGEVVRDALYAAGMSETISYAFTSRARIRALRFPEGSLLQRPLPITNPMREEQEVMRTSLVPNLLAQLGHNLAFGQEDVRLFEVGSIFLPSGKKLPDEPMFVGAVLAGRRPGWLKPEGEIDFYDVKGIIERLFAALRLTPDFDPARHEHGFLHPGVAAAVRVGDIHAGILGEVHPETRDRMGIEARCFAFELNLDILPTAPPAELRPWSRLPAVVRDVSFFVDESTPAAAVRRVVERERPPILEELAVLEDYREPGKVPPGKKGMLWTMTYRAPASEARTLTDAEVDAAHEALVARLLTELHADRR